MLLIHLTMKRIILAISISLGTSCLILVYGQDDYVIGDFKSYPLGTYASTDLMDDGGFAEPGWGFMLEKKLSVRSWPEGLSLGLHFSYQNNKIENVPYRGSSLLLWRLSGGTSTFVDISPTSGWVRTQRLRLEFRLKDRRVG